MTVQSIEADYLIVGAGAAAMAFADELLTDTDATMVIVDRNHRPGGHWNDAYPFVRLHLPAAYYGVNSRMLGSGSIETHGLNKGFHELASGPEILAYFDSLMRERMLPSGRVRYFPSSEFHDGRISSRVSSQTLAVRPRKIVDATLSNTAVPSTRAPAFPVAEGITCRPVNDLPRLARPDADYTIIGAGKTGIDACCWLLENGADPDRIRWIMPRDYWLLDRANYQPGAAFFARRAGALANEVEAIVEATSIEDVFAGLESRGVWRRIDPQVPATGYHGAIVSDGELEQMRRIKAIVRLGRVRRIDSDRIVLEHGTVPTGPDVLHIDCSSSGVPSYRPGPVFDGDRIRLEWVRISQPIFSAAFIGHVEAAYADETEKNRLCPPMPPPETALDWIRMMAVEMNSRYRWSKDAALSDWIAASRLDGFAGLVRGLKPTDTEAIAHLQRYAKSAGAASVKLQELLTGLDAPKAA